jgi:hypothetical protein
MDSDIALHYNGNSGECCICEEAVDLDNLTDWLSCTKSDCPMIAHILCLARSFLEQETDKGVNNLIPIQGICPCCSSELKWGNLVKGMKSRILADRFDLQKDQEVRGTSNTPRKKDNMFSRKSPTKTALNTPKRNRMQTLSSHAFNVSGPHSFGFSESEGSDCDFSRI